MGFEPLLELSWINVMSHVMYDIHPDVLNI